MTNPCRGGCAVLLMLASCAVDAGPPAPPGWKRVDLEAFTLLMPEDMVEVPVKPIDSFVRHYQRGTLLLSFDYGQWSDPLEDSKPPESEWTEVSGRRAYIAHFKPGGDREEYLSGIHFPEVWKNEDGRVLLTVALQSPTPVDRALALQVFRSIRFPAR